ncbi:MAG: alpha/beta fold hydrolase [Rhodospirillales bacterium]|jgi:uncharacterized OsmC-like protein/alpha/beta superfamily hydrolase|nr:alpha/beta fold hydrolase [Rhodospirillales bacterium]
MGSQGEKIEFTGAQGGKLAARLDLPTSSIRAYALFAHCFTCSKDIFAASRISQGLADLGIAVLRFDFTGLGHSEGEFANTNFTSNVADLLAAVDWLRQNREAPAIIIGHSLGGAAVLAAAGSIPEAKAIATIGAPADPAHVSHNFGNAIEVILENGEAEVKLGGRPFTIKQQFLDDIAEQKIQKSITTMRKALLVFHAPMDNQVGIDNAGVIFQAAKHPKSFVSLDDADHLLSRREDATYVSQVISSWATRYLDEARQTADITAAAGTVVVAESGKGKFAQAVSVGGVHAMLADEPVDYGGTDTGPSPYDFLLAGLGACTSMTLRMYADHKNIPLEHVAVTLKHDKIHATDCETCETQDGKIDRIEREIEISGNLDDDTRKRLLEIADRCPVHKTLHSEVEITSRLKE